MGETPEPFKLRYLPLLWDDPNDAVSYIANTLGNMAAAERTTCFPVCGCLEKAILKTV